jgi:hypothetical protein
VRAGSERELHQRPVRAGRGEDVDGIGREVGHHPLGVGAGVRDSEALRDRGCERGGQVADAHYLDVVDPAELAQVGVGDAAEPDQDDT